MTVVRFLIAHVALLMAAAPAAAQVVSSTLDGVEAPASYLLRLGDDPSYADPDLETSDRPGAERAQEGGAGESWREFEVGVFPADFSGIGWLRFEIELDERWVGRPIGLRVEQEGAAEVFLDGRRVHAFGTPSRSAEGEISDRTRDPRPIIFERGGRHVLAVRYSAWMLEAPRWVGQQAMLTIRLGELRPMVEGRLRLVRLLTFHQMLLTGLFVAFALVNLMLFLFRPVAGPNLFCGLAALFSAATVFLNFGAYVQRDPGTFLVFYTLFQLAFIALASVSLRFVYSCVVRRPPWHFRLFLLAGAAVAGWAILQPIRAQLYGLVFMLAVNAEMIRSVLARRRGEHDAIVEETWILGVGAIPLAVFSPYQILAGLDLLPQLWDFLAFPSPYYGLAALMFAMTVFIGRNFAKTQKQLERELERVQRLSEEKLEQERLTREKEVERARLEVENTRRAEELEEARRLQTSMLPSAIPSSQALEIAVRAETATEVGGDYYDFRRRPESLTVIVGDASGHGAQAGSLVAATKGMLLTASDATPAACLDRLSRGLRRMGLRRRHMALLAARFTSDGRRMTLASAAMPPALIYRVVDRTVESVTIPSLPLGSFREESYEQIEIELEPGDRVVLMSDGLPETTDGDLQPLGYERVEELVAENGHLRGENLIERLLEAGRRHAGTGPPDDDVTVVVVSIRSPMVQ